MSSDPTAPDFDPNLLLPSSSKNKTSGKDKTAVKRKPSIKKTVLTQMHSSTSGPRSILHTAIKERKKIKVAIRSFRFVRGFITGFLVAFDRHLNLAMIDVDEIYLSPIASKRKKRKRKRKEHSQTEPQLSNDACSEIEKKNRSGKVCANDQQEIDELTKRLLALQKELESIEQEEQQSASGRSPSPTSIIDRAMSSTKDKSEITASGYSEKEPLSSKFPTTASSTSTQPTRSISSLTSSKNEKTNTVPSSDDADLTTTSDETNSARTDPSLAELEQIIHGHRYRLMRRYVPQLFVRGDNVVLIQFA